MKTFILNSHEQDHKVTVEDDVRARSLRSDYNQTIVFERCGRVHTEDQLVAAFNNINIAYEEGTNIEVRTTVAGAETKGKWESV